MASLSKQGRESKKQSDIQSEARTSRSVLRQSADISYSEGGSSRNCLRHSVQPIKTKEKFIKKTECDLFRTWEVASFHCSELRGGKKRVVFTLENGSVESEHDGVDQMVLKRHQRSPLLMQPVGFFLCGCAETLNATWQLHKDGSCAMEAGSVLVIQISHWDL